jgi:hypothetical protein
MGTDICCAIERHDGERWRFAAPLELERNRYLFEVLALGDRPIAAPRGLPPDGDPKTDTKPPEYEEADYADRFGGHDRSYLTLTELRGYDWSRVPDDNDTTGDIPLRDRDLSADDRDMVTRRGKRWEPFERWSLTSPHRPDFYSPGPPFSAASRGVRLITDDAEARRLLSGPPLVKRIWVRVRWRETIGERCADFFRWIRSQDAFDGERTRIIFGFDG